jgi:mono/diheme cytochrome c family protein
MKKLDWAFCSLAFLLLVLAIITGVRELHAPWKPYQEKYKEELVFRAGLGRDTAARIPLEVKQDWLPAMDRTDRCRSCHVSVLDPVFRKASQPLRTHPGTHHREFETFGCSVCHEGQGLALNVQEAHGRAENWGYPLLPGAFTEGSCGRCHLSRTVPEAPNLTRGRGLIERYQCAGCHAFGDFEPKERPGLDLRGIGSKVGSGWLKAWLARPRDYLPRARMPNFKLREDQILALGAFLLSSRNEKVDSFKLPEISKEKEEELVALGKKRFSEARCVTCHQVEGKGGTLGPDLGAVGDKASKEWLFLWLEDPTTYQKFTEMPSFSFPAEDVRALAEFLHREYSSGSEPKAVPEMEKPAPGLAAKGRELARTYGCYGCHLLPDGVSGGKVGPNLTEIASVALGRIDFGRAGIRRSLSNYLFVKQQKPRVFGDNTKMPEFEFTVDEAARVTIALLSQTRRGVVEKYLQRELRKGEDFQPQGEIGRLLGEYRCFSCHKFFGRGGTLAPELTYVGSQLKPEYLKNYVMHPDTVRPFLEERMPVLGMGQEKVQLFADYARMVLTSDRVSEVTVPTDPQAIERGRLLFGKYSCIACHIIDGKGGYYGPVLDRAGTRLKPEWIYFRLLDPAALNPESREPKMGLTAQEALDLTAYLSTKKGLQ